MTIVPHALAGAAIATFTDNAWVAFLLGVLSHLVLDFIPHIEPGTFFTDPEQDKHWPRWVYGIILGEFVFLLIFLFWFGLNHDPAKTQIVFWGGLGGLAIDLIDHNPFKNTTRSWPVFAQVHWLHLTFHRDLPRQYWYLGIPLAIIILGGSLWLLLGF